MPNDVLNFLDIAGDYSLIEDIRTKYFQGINIDFNKVVPMPESLSIKSLCSSGTEECVLLYLMSVQNAIPSISGIVHESLSETDISHVLQQFGIFNSGEYYRRIEHLKQAAASITLDELINKINYGRLYYINLLTYGFFDWYGWRWHNWGTKWNSYDPELQIELIKNTLTLRFFTAWDPPFPIIAKLIELYPELEIVCESEDPNMNYKWYIGHIPNDSMVIYYRHDLDDEMEY